MINHMDLLRKYLDLVRSESSTSFLDRLLQTGDKYYADGTDVSFTEEELNELRKLAATRFIPEPESDLVAVTGEYNLWERQISLSPSELKPGRTVMMSTELLIMIVDQLNSLSRVVRS